MEANNERFTSSSRTQVNEFPGITCSLVFYLFQLTELSRHSACWSSSTWNETRLLTTKLCVTVPACCETSKLSEGLIISLRRGRQVVARARKTFASVIMAIEVSAIQLSKPSFILCIIWRTRIEKGMHTTLAANTITTMVLRRRLICIGQTRHKAHKTIMSSALTSMAVMAVHRLICRSKQVNEGVGAVSRSSRLT